MQLSKFELSDLSEITTLFSDVIMKMQENNIMQWDDNYPDNQSIREDLKNGELFGIRHDDKIIAVVTLNNRYSREYDALNWQLNPSEYMVVHRLAVSPPHQNKGLARKIMTLAEKQALSRNYKGIRLDTYTQNPKNLYFYKSLDYREIGLVHFRHMEAPFMCYEKIF